MGESFELCLKTVQLLKQQLIELGFKVHEQKSVVEKFELAAKVILKEKTNTIRQVASLIGLMVDYSKGIDYGEAHYRRLEREKTLALEMNKGNFDRKMTVF